MGPSAYSAQCGDAAVKAYSQPLSAITIHRDDSRRAVVVMAMAPAKWWSWYTRVGQLEFTTGGVGLLRLPEPMPENDACIQTSI